MMHPKWRFSFQVAYSLLNVKVLLIQAPHHWPRWAPATKKAYEAKHFQGRLEDRKWFQQLSDKRFRAVKSTLQNWLKVKARGLQENSGIKTSHSEIV
jgi:hypothetical protein